MSSMEERFAAIESSLVELKTAVAALESWVAERTAPTPEQPPQPDDTQPATPAPDPPVAPAEEPAPDA